MKKIVPFILVGLLLGTMALTGCKREETNEIEKTEVQTEAETPGPADEPEDLTDDKGVLRVVSLKGPTSLGLLHFIAAEEEAETREYEFEMVVDASEAAAMLTTNKADIALLPANLAANLYHKTDGGVTVININTLGVVYLVQAGEPLTAMTELEGKTIYVPGKGTTPDLSLQYLLKEQGVNLDNVNIEYKSEATEIVVALQQDEDGIGLLPQPFATVATTQNPDLKIVFDLTEEWDKLQGEGGSTLVTGVTAVRTEYLKENEDQVRDFLIRHEESAMKANDELEVTASLAEKYDIIKEAVALTAIPKCNITFIAGAEMKDKLEGYLEVLFDLNAEVVGGRLPEEGFYFQ